jgi:glutamate-5-semialdehyde dehydrogenase
MPTADVQEVRRLAEKAKSASRALAVTRSNVRDRALLAMADSLIMSQSEILEANAKDMRAGREKGLTESLLDRLALNASRLAAMSDAVKEIAALPDPLGEVVLGRTLANGLRLRQVRVPLGVIGMIYEARPNVTVDAAALAIKTGNAIVLRGGSVAVRSNLALTKAIAAAAESAGIPAGAISSVSSTDREAATELMRQNGLVDVLIPRGGAGLIQNVVKNATVPVIETGVGNCHVYVDAAADLDAALAIILNAKTQRPGVCNAAESLVVHRDVAAEFLPRVAAALDGVVLLGDGAARALLPGIGAASEEDFAAEFLGLTMSVAVVDDLDAAIDHITRYGSGHSEAIVTRDIGAAGRFTTEVDAAAVVVNASTRFVDGGELGLGAEIGIATSRLHWRGPMGLESLTTMKWVVDGEGQTRG